MIDINKERTEKIFFITPFLYPIPAKIIKERSRISPTPISLLIIIYPIKCSSLKISLSSLSYFGRNKDPIFFPRPGFSA